MHEILSGYKMFIFSLLSVLKRFNSKSEILASFNMQYDEVIIKLNSLKNPEAVKGMARFGINPKNNLGIRVTTLREFAKEIGKDHDLALKLWGSGIHDARMLAAHIDDPKLVTEEQMEKWANGFDSWDVCDNCCMHLFYKTQFAYEKIVEWSEHEKEFVKRAGFTLIASLSIHDKKSDDKIFEEFLQIIKRESTDERNYVKKAMNWALRQIGKRNWDLNKRAINIAREIKKIDSKSASWIASDVIKELTGEKVKHRLNKKRNEIIFLVCISPYFYLQNG